MAADVSGLRAKALARYGRVAEESAQALQTNLRIDAPHKTYELRNSIEVKARRSGPTSWTIVAEAPVVQAATTNSGARPHIIRPRRAKMLSFYWPKVGARVAFRFVNHPGNRGTHWWDKVLDRRSAIIGAVLRRL
jgi:hypothetical protein